MCKCVRMCACRSFMKEKFEFECACLRYYMYYVLERVVKRMYIQTLT